MTNCPRLKVFVQYLLDTLGIEYPQHVCLLQCVYTCTHNMRFFLILAFLHPNQYIQLSIILIYSCIHTYVSLYVCMYPGIVDTHMCMPSVHATLYTRVHLSVHATLYTHVHASVHATLYTHVHLSVHATLYTHVHLSVHATL